MTLLNCANHSLLIKTELKHGNARIIEELSGDGTADKLRKFFRTARNILFRLHC